MPGTSFSNMLIVDGFGTFFRVLVIGVGILTFVGIKSTIDLTSIESQTTAMKRTASELQAQYQPLKDELPKLNQIATSLRGLEDRIGTVESAVARFAPSSAIEPATQAQLIAVLKRYTAYLKTLGLVPRSIPTVHVQAKLPRDGYDAYFEDNDIYVKPDHANPACGAAPSLASQHMVDAGPVDDLGSGGFHAAMIILLPSFSPLSNP